MSPADTLTAFLEELCDEYEGLIGGMSPEKQAEWRADSKPHAALASARALLAVGERDKALLAQSDAALTSLEVILFGNDRCRTRDELDKRAEELVAAGERDRRQIAQLTEALEEITDSRTSFGDDTIYANHAERVAYNALTRLRRAVLAGEEDARPEMTYEQASEFTFGAIEQPRAAGEGDT